tara:strand:- start:215 stop:484 length:270 start_codon:yes stop_codon:yes gene_type:complete
LAFRTIEFLFDFGNPHVPVTFCARHMYGADEMQALMPQEETRPLPVEFADCPEGDGLFLRNNAYRQLFETGNALCLHTIFSYCLADLSI